MGRDRPQLNAKLLLMSCGVSVGIACACNLLGYNWFRISTTSDLFYASLSGNVAVWVQGIVSTLHIWLTVIAVSGRLSRRVWWLGACLILPFTLAIQSTLRVTFATELVQIFFALYLRHRVSIKQVVYRWALYQVIIAAYISATYWIKLGVLVFDGRRVYPSTLDGLIFELDLILFQLLIIFAGGVRLGRDCVDLPRMGRRRDSGVTQPDAPAAELDRYRRGLRDLGHTAMVWGIQLAELTVVCLTAYFNRKLLVFVLAYLLGFLPQRIAKTMGKAYHADALYRKPDPGKYSFKLAGICFAQSWIAFYMLSMSLPVVGVSLMLPPVGGALLAWATNWFGWKISSTDVNREVYK